MTVLTGETGAGKSIIDAMNLMLDRALVSDIRHGAKKLRLKTFSVGENAVPTHFGRKWY